MIDSLILRLWSYPRHVVLQTTLGGAIVITLLLFALLGQFFFNPFVLLTSPFEPPSYAHPFGTDFLGRDVLSRLIVGTGQTLTAAATAVGIATVIGSLSGVLSGYIGGKLDRAITMVMDAWYSFPDIVMALLIIVLLGSGAFNAGLAIGLALIPQFFRVLRSDSFSTKSATYIEAERVLGASTRWILLRHLVPAALPSLIVMMTIGLARAVLTLGGLGFLGLGVAPPTPEWGAELGYAKNAIVSGIWWPTAYAGLMIFIAVIGFNQLGNGLRAMVAAQRST